MNFREFSDKGLYVAAKFSDSTLDALERIQGVLAIPNRVDRDKMHCTIVYSKKNVPYRLSHKETPIADKAWLETWPTKYGNTLVLRFDSEVMQKRFNYANALGATFDFPDYKPHITLSYDIGPLKYAEQSFDISLVKAYEYAEDLDDNALSETVERRGDDWVCASKTKVLGKHNTRVAAIEQLRDIQQI